MVFSNWQNVPQTLHWLAAHPLNPMSLVIKIKVTEIFSCGSTRKRRVFAECHCVSEHVAFSHFLSLSILSSLTAKCSVLLSRPCIYKSLNFLLLSDELQNIHEANKHAVIDGGALGQGPSISNGHHLSVASRNRVPFFKKPSVAVIGVTGAAKKSND